MGCYRFGLAVAVLASHLGIRIFGLNPGVFAVVQFFGLTGLVITKQLEEKFLIRKNLWTNSKRFIRDRAIRIYPQFLFYSLAGWIAIKSLELKSNFVSELSLGKIMLHFLIVPNNFYMYFNNRSFIIPQTWSLGLESIFYLLIPFIIFQKNLQLLAYSSYFSFIFFIFPFLGILNTDYFGYRFIPGTFWIFALGCSYVYRNPNTDRLRFTLTFASGILLIIAMLNSEIGSRYFNKEVLIGVLTFVSLNKLQVLKKFNKFGYLGNLSYGIFLNHLFIIWYFQKYSDWLHLHHLMLLLTIVTSTLASYITYSVIEAPVSRWRRKL
jgi:peptidoglycan/LPS O-acetylase OafA/YrhL